MLHEVLDILLEALNFRIFLFYLLFIHREPVLIDVYGSATRWDLLSEEGGGGL